MFNTETSTKNLAAYLPDGLAMEAKNIPSTNLYKFLDAIAKNLVLFCDTLTELTDFEMNIETTETLISRWEQEYGLPANYMPEATTLEERRLNLKIKIALNGVQTIEEYIALFTQFGFPIEIEKMSETEVFPFNVNGFPITLSGFKFNRFTIIVKLPTSFNTEVFPFSTNGFPITLLNSLASTFIERLFRKIVPANVNIIFKYVL